MAETWRQRHHRATREELLAVARGMMLEEGLEGLGVRELARRTGFGAASIYTYFSGKEAIVGAITSESVRELEAYLDRVPDEDTPAVRLRGLCDAYLDFAEENPADFACIVEVGLKGGPVAEVTAAGAGRVRERLGALLAEATDGRAAAASGDPAAGLFALVHGLAVLRQAGAAGLAQDGPRHIVRASLAALGVRDD